MASPPGKESWDKFIGIIARPQEMVKGWSEDDLRAVLNSTTPVELSSLTALERADIVAYWKTLNAPEASTSFTVPAGPTVGNVKATFSTLVWRHDPLITVNLHVIDRAIKRFAPRVQLAVAGMDPELAYDIYDEAHRLPATYTELELNTDFGYQINGNLIRDNDNLVICFKDTTPYILKMLTIKEYQAMMQIKDRLPPHNHIIQITELVQVKHGKQFAIMPILPATLEGLLKFTPATALRFWNQMASALEAFHRIRFAHNDIKPANICLSSTGDFVLIDLGSVAEFGARVASTTAYHPKVAKDSELKFNVASASLDWWMLAAVLTEKACGLEWGGTSNPSVRVVQQLLEEKLPQVWEELHLKLLQAV